MAGGDESSGVSLLPLSRRAGIVASWDGDDLSGILLLPPLIFVSEAYFLLWRILPPSFGGALLQRKPPSVYHL